MKLALTLAALLAGTAAFAEGTATGSDAAATPPDRAAFIALMEAHDCKLAFADAEKVLTDAGFTPDIGNPIMEALTSEGLLEIGSSEMILKTGNCN